MTGRTGRHPSKHAQKTTPKTEPCDTFRPYDRVKFLLLNVFLWSDQWSEMVRPEWRLVPTRMANGS
jgi:hypothetical protein